ncbi:MAG: hypothetical protein ACYC1M_17190 [Armatimonadota bacterium]
MATVREFLDSLVLRKEQIDHFLDPEAPNWAKFDTELGYTLRDSVVRDGMDQCLTFGSYGSYGERQMVHYGDQPCRINTYGDSFTMCHQVSDGETWQEYLAAHFGEPIRNYGVGGYGVYQAFRRMMRTEATDAAVKYVVMNIWGSDDHHRSIDSFRYMRCIPWFNAKEAAYMFHSNPWDYVRFNPQNGALEEHKSLCPTPQSLYALTDPDYIQSTFTYDVVTQMYMIQQHCTDVPLDQVKQTAEMLGLSLQWDTPEHVWQSNQTTYFEYAHRASIEIVNRAFEWAKRTDRKLMIMQSYGDAHVVDVLEGRRRHDQGFSDWLHQSGYPYIDAIEKHVQDFKDYRVDAWTYARRLFIGHYNPKGTHFYAFSMKDDLLQWLNPAPPAYRSNEQVVGFGNRYLPGG